MVLGGGGRQASRNGLVSSSPTRNPSRCDSQLAHRRRVSDSPVAAAAAAASFSATSASIAVQFALLSSATVQQVSHHLNKPRHARLL
jgi:hypothetical protein